MNKHSKIFLKHQISCVSPLLDFIANNKELGHGSKRADFRSVGATSGLRAKYNQGLKQKLSLKMRERYQSTKVVENKMIPLPELYSHHLKKHLDNRQYLILSILVNLLQGLHQVPAGATRKAIK